MTLRSDRGPGRHGTDGAPREPAEGDSLERHVGRLDDAADAMNAGRDVPATLDAIVTQASLTLPWFDRVGVSMVERPRGWHTVAQTDDLGRRLDDLQYRLGEGPCLSALADGGVAVVRHARHEQRWPGFIRRAVPLGLRSAIGSSMSGDESRTVLNLYSTQTEILTPYVVHLAELFASHASHALGHARRAAHLETALATRSLIGQAVGIVMERYGLDDVRAFEYLTRTSSTSNVKVRDLALELVRTRGEAGARGATPVEVDYR